MKSTLTIKDLALDKALDRKAMSAVRGGGDQANSIVNKFLQDVKADVSVGNGSSFGDGAILQVHSTPKLSIDNDVYARNRQYFGW